MNATLDYYGVLGVSSTATLDQIKRGYRAKVMQCHPDRGGTHVQMVAVVEAWEILSDPELREQYDRARAEPYDLNVQEAWQASASSARTKAEQRSRNWSGLKAHLDAVTGDVANAEYETQSYGLFSFATVNHSITGWIFIVAGAAYGLVLAISAIVLYLPPKSQNKATGLFVLFGLGLGTKLGQFAHRAIRDYLRDRQNRRPIVPCTQCGQRLRLPDVGQTIEVHCGRCDARFTHQPDLAARLQRLEAEVKGRWKRRAIWTAAGIWGLSSILTIAAAMTTKRAPNPPTPGQTDIDRALSQLRQPNTAADSDSVQQLRRKAEGGDAFSQAAMGIMYLGDDQRAGDPVEAAKWLRKAADQNFPAAQVALGVLYKSGQGVPKDDAAAAVLFRKAADRGIVQAQTFLGGMYMLGEGVPRDDVEAARWFRKAAEQGNAEGQYLLATRYVAGQGVGRDVDEAARWLRRASAQGHKEASDLLAQLGKAN